MPRTIFKLHLCSALFLGVVIATLGLTGSILALEEDLDTLLNPQLYRVPIADSRVPILTILSSLGEQYPATRGLAIRLAQQPGRTHLVQAGQTQYFLNPYNGGVAGIRQLPSAFTWIHRIHGTLLIGHAGSQISRAAVVVLVLLVISGIYLWWPYRRWSISFKSSLRRITFDAHLAVGVYTGALFALLGVTGFLMVDGFELGARLLATSGPKPKPLRRDAPSVPQPGILTVPAEEAIESACRAIPGATPMSLTAPRNATASYLVTMRLPGDRNNGGRSWVNVDQYSGKPVNIATWQQAPYAARVKDFTRALHTGDILGYPTRILMSGASLLVVLQMFTGTFLWWRKLRSRKRQSPAVAAASTMLLAAMIAPTARGADPPAPELLRKECAACHNDQNRSSGLSLANRESLLKGGNRGPAILPGKASQSLLIKALEQGGELKMPPGRKVPAATITAITEWIDRGAEWTSSPAPAKPTTSKHWSFQPVKRSAPPVVRNTAWVKNAIDSFVLANLERRGIDPSPEADRRTLIRRLALDLTGLPPSPGEVQRFLEDQRPDAYERLVDQLLASPHHGERWARHWLDAARYADSNGYTRDGARQIWRYRDWVIEAINNDMPFDQFLIEQLAGDLLPNATQAQIIATGFHRNTLINLEGGVYHEQYRTEAVADRVSTTGQVFLGLTLGCARCHDHKFDPISQREFYQLFAFFNSIDELAGQLTDDDARRHFAQPVLEFGTPAQLAQRDAHRVKLASLKQQLEEFEQTLYVKYLDWRRILTPEQQAKLTPQALAALKTAPERRSSDHRKLLRRTFAVFDPTYQQHLEAIKQLESDEPSIPYTMVMRDLPAPRPTNIFLGGDFTRKGIAVESATPAVLPPLRKQGASANRLDLARWLADPKHPLTPRVTVNRIWQQYFGRGIVETEDDFGVRGSLPTHPELLDWLADEFIANGWSQKKLHRLIVTSAAYRQSSKIRKDLEKTDPNNRLLARQARMRLEAEVVRDVALTASGLLNPVIGGPSVFPPQPELASLKADSGPWVADKGENRYRRGMYTSMRRGAPHTVLSLFDAPDPSHSCTRRNRSNTPLQALAMLNDEAFHEFAIGLANRILSSPPVDQAARLRFAFELCLGRLPDAIEAERLTRFTARQYDHFQSHPEEAQQIAGASSVREPALQATWIAVGRVLLNLDEFITRE